MSVWLWMCLVGMMLGMMFPRAQNFMSMVVIVLGILILSDVITLSPGTC